MKKFLSIIGILTLLLTMSFTVKDFFSSMTKVDYDESANTLKFTTKLNTDHVSKAINIDPKTASFEAEVKKYVNSKMSVSINGNSQNLVFTGSQTQGGSVWINYEVRNVTSISTIKIKNALLLDIYPKQLNVVNISYKGNQKNMTFTKGDEVSEVSF
ncbi:DUF6702 family protein [Riemerella columbipharyngis]|uniref:M penetrans family 1 protein n=1 Tax=Riemerella columbipharyngis TaxID=1071918 RepID=A0A1G7D488_9FLAO|nr:DUF6702 family protein [Riemerella columbipharyngis]SDE46484.1 hypothetical protein SAMN05421544_1108 [Riemerella columbipharyngis]